MADEVYKKDSFRESDLDSSEEETVTALSAITGLPTSSIRRLRGKGENLLTESEYEVLSGRCPSTGVPESVIKSARNKFLSDIPAVGCSPSKDAVLMASSWNPANDLERVKLRFERVDPKCLPYTRLYPDHYLSMVASRGGWNRDIEEVLAYAITYKWSTGRAAATFLAVIQSSEFALNELMFLGKRGGFAADSFGWIKMGSAHHQACKVLGIAIHTDVRPTVKELAGIIYMQSLVGRDGYFDVTSYDKEESSRTGKPDSYTMCDAQKGIDFHEYSTASLSAALRNTAAVDDKVQTFGDWEKTSMVKEMPGGATSIGVSGGIKVNSILEMRGRADINPKAKMGGTKRLRADLESLDGEVPNLGQWIVNAFMKYEVYKNRWIYPADFDYTKLGIYMQKPVKRAFEQLSGVDLGHTVGGALQVRLDVLKKLVDKWDSFNADGKAFNSHHSIKDMQMIYECALVAVRCADQEAMSDLRKAIDAYVGRLDDREVVLTGLAGVLDRKFIAWGTLFSGEPVTQFANTGILWSILNASLSAMLVMRVGHRMAVFLKGDDLNGFVDHWLTGVALLKLVEQAGMATEPSKDHCERGRCEHERCLVDSEAYYGALMRKIGSLVISEPQGTAVLDLSAAISSANEARMSVAIRSGKPREAMWVFEAIIATRLNDANYPDELGVLCGMPVSMGGFDCWRDGYPCGPVVKRPQVNLELRWAAGSRFAEFGGAKMTDAFVSDFATKFNLRLDDLMAARDITLLTGIEGSVPATVTSNLVKANVSEVLLFAIKEVSGDAAMQSYKLLLEAREADAFHEAVRLAVENGRPPPAPRGPLNSRVLTGDDGTRAGRPRLLSAQRKLSKSGNGIRLERPLTRMIDVREPVLEGKARRKKKSKGRKRKASSGRALSQIVRDQKKSRIQKASPALPSGKGGNNKRSKLPPPVVAPSGSRLVMRSLGPLNAESRLIAHSWGRELLERIDTGRGVVDCYIRVGQDVVLDYIAGCGHLNVHFSETVIQPESRREYYIMVLGMTSDHESPLDLNLKAGCLAVDRLFGDDAFMHVMSGKVSGVFWDKDSLVPLDVGGFIRRFVLSRFLSRGADVGLMDSWVNVPSVNKLEAIIQHMCEQVWSVVGNKLLAIGY